MAGSRKKVSYTDGLGETWALDVDESNWESVNGNGYDVTDTNVGDHTYLLPPNVRPRMAWYRSETTVKVRKVPLATATIYLNLLLGSGVREFDEGGETFKFYRLEPESFRPIVFALDTGLNEGDFT